MSICEHMLNPSGSVSDQTGEDNNEKMVSIQNEILWGLTYRNYKNKEKEKPLMPVHSPIQIPFELCRARMMLKAKAAASRQDGREQGAGEGEGQADVDIAATNKRPKKKRKFSAEKPSLLDRNVWSQNKYMDYLSIPNLKIGEPKSKKYKKRCELEPCPPRFVQLAVPNKRRVFANWKEYYNFLPTEMLMRFEEILHTDQNLEPREARYYYKKLDKQKYRKMKKKRLQLKKKKLRKEQNSDALQINIELLAYNILQYIRDEPLFALNYKQMLLSDAILERLAATQTMKKLSRKTKKQFNKTVIEVSDKLSIWIDTLTKFVDVQAIESDTDIPPVSIPSLVGEGEEESESESEYESSTEGEELRDSQLFEPAEGWGEDEDKFMGASESATSAAEAFMSDLLKPGEGEEATDLHDFMSHLDGDALDKLIAILSDCSDDFLDKLIDDDKMPGIKYRDVLNRLKALKDKISGAGDKPFLEQIMIDWATQNDPDKVDDEILQKIHEVAGLLGDVLTAKKSPAGEMGEETEPEDEEFSEVEGQTSTDVSAAEKFEGPSEGESGTEGASEIEGDEAETSEAKPAGGAEMGGDKVGSGEGESTEGEGEGTEGEGEKTESEKAEAEKTEGEKTEGEGESTEGEGEIGERDMEKEGGPEFSEAEEGGVSTFEAFSSGLMDEEGPAISEFGEELLPEEMYEGVEEGEEAYIPAKPMKPVPVKPVSPVPAVTAPGEAAVSVPGERLVGEVIKGHKPSKVFEHSPDTVCCLSLKTWAVWLLDITHNAHNWTQWMSCVIQQIKEYASIVRGEVKDSNGQVKTLPKAEWRKFITETEESIIGWRQYSAHVKDLSQSIVDNFHGKRVNCCPKCLQDHLITDVVVAHETLQALTEAISCAAYWQRCLDNLVEKACGLTKAEKDKGLSSSSSETESSEVVDLEDVAVQHAEESGESVYEIEDLAEDQDQGPSPAKL